MRPSRTTMARLGSPQTRRFLANAALIAGALIAAGWLWCGSRWGGPAPPASSVGESGPESSTTRVSLPAEKLATAAIATAPASIQTLAHSHTVPGRLEYDSSRRLELRLPAECVVKQVLVRPGQQVPAGAELAVLTSQQVGLARSEVQHCEEDLNLARYQQEWTDQLGANVGDLLASLAKSPSMAQLEADYESRPLGEHRAKLFAAYSELLLATVVHQDSAGLGDRGVLSGRTIQDRRSKLERARATFQGECEAAKYHSNLARQTAATAVARAERALKISGEQLATLVGPYAAARESSGNPLNDFALTAPYAGSIDELHAAPSAVLPANAPLMTLANTDHLWVEAQIHERNWRAASIARGQTVSVRTPATGAREFAATIEFVGAAVDPETRALPLVARIDNLDALLRPGMFVWVTVPVEPPREVLAVPASAVMRHEGRAFVFVAEGAGRFRRVDIATGLETEAWVEVRQGLAVGDPVASAGAFTLKSELLLEREES